MDTQVRSTRRWRDRTRSWAVPINPLTSAMPMPLASAEGKPSYSGGTVALARAVPLRRRMEARASRLVATLENEATRARAVGTNDRLIKRLLDLALASNDRC